MLSICIPVFNQDVTQLVGSMRRQAADAGHPVEIIVLDDGSLPEWKKCNRPLAGHSMVRYEELPKNVGRSRIRNLLYEKASYRYLLILDCDTAVTENTYIQKYMKAASGGTVVCGGRIYGQRPENADLLLHWLIGSNREVTTARERQKKPHHSFITGNFLIDRTVFEAIRFDESISGYGHEDTLFGYQLMKRGIPVNHIDNPLMHLGLDPAKEFLKKTREGLRNLVKTYELVNRDPDYAGMVKILRFYGTLRKLRLQKVLGLCSAPIKNRLERILTGRTPRLWIYDLYKLMYLCRIDK